MAPSWPDEERTAPDRLELGYCQLPAMVFEIPSVFEYIDFVGPPDHPGIPKIGGYIAGLQSSPF